jgi:RNA polymerase binding protein RbpA
MADRVMRGSRLGAVSYETDRNHDLAPRQIARYRTENGEEFEVPFADDAVIPDTWLCRNGMEGTLIEGGDLAEPKKVKVPRTPWTCCGNAARSRNLRNCSRNASRSSSQAAAAASLATGRGHEPRPAPGPLTEKIRSDDSEDLL